jgi:hypothetical protein
MALESESLADVLLPGGVALGHAGAHPSVRIVPGGAEAALALFERLCAGGVKERPEGAEAVMCRRVDGTTVSHEVRGDVVVIEISGSATWIKRLEFAAFEKARDGGSEM